MILALMAYCILAGGLAGLTALGAEAALRATRRPGRVPWIIAIAVTLIAPLSVPFFPADGVLAVPVAVRDAGSMTVAPTERMVGFASLDPLVVTAWILGSMALLTALRVAGARLHRLRRTWRSANLLGTRVWVSRHVGPAVIGLWNGEIVVPEWALDGGSEAVGLLIEHERQHLAARDHRLRGVALGALVLMPWNVPLWWIVARLRLATEIDCDARVLAGTRSDIESYGSLLIAVGRRLSHAPAAGIAFSRPVSDLEHRIRALTAQRGPDGYRRGVGWLGLSAFSFTLLCVAPHPVIQVCRFGPEGAAGGGVLVHVTPQPPVVVRMLDSR